MGAPRICGLDIETTGLDHGQDHVTELAWIIKEWGDPKPLVLKSHFVLPPENMFDSKEYIKPNIEQLTKITMRHLMTGKYFDQVLMDLSLDLEAHKVDFVAAHNGENFDRPFIRAKAKQLRSSVADDALAIIDARTWVDTSVDCLYPEDCRSTNLLYVSAYFGFLNPFPHAALFDVATMLKVLDQFEFAKVADRAKSPWCIVKANVSYDNRQLAKARRYAWETLGDKTFPKTWVKRIKEMELEKEQAEAGFEVTRIA